MNTRNQLDRMISDWELHSAASVPFEDLVQLLDLVQKVQQQAYEDAATIAQAIEQGTVTHSTTIAHAIRQRAKEMSK